MFKEFRKFIMRGNVVDLAVAVVVGTAFNSLVQALVKDLFTPLISAIGGNHDFSGLTFILNGSTFRYGDVINAAISFLTIALVVFFFVVQPINKIEERAKRLKRPEDPTEKKCPECFSTIPIKATRCAFCSIKLPADKAKA